MNRINKKRLFLMIVLALMSACSGSPPQEGTSIDRMTGILDDGINATAQKAKEPSIPPADIQQGLLPPLDMGLPDTEGKLVEQRFDISVDNASAREFFMGLVDGTTYNMIVHPSVSGNISLKLKNVTIDEVMETVRDVYGYEYRKNRTGYQVIRAGMRTKVFQVNYLNIQRSGTSRMRVSSGEVSQAGSSDDTANNNNSAADTVSGTELVTETFTDFWKELSATLKMVVGTEGGRSVVASPQSGVVLVRALPNELRDVEHFIETIQSIVQRQVVIEAKILEVELNDGFQSGINWAGIAENNKGRTAVFGQTGGGSAIGTSGAGVTGISGNTGDLSPTALSQVAGNEVAAFGGVFTLALNFNDFTSFIELLETQGNVQVLSSPRVSTLNNQKAVIKVGNDEFFVTEVSSSTVTSGTNSVVSPDITLTPFFSGIALDVTPQINEKQEVILHIRPMVSEVSDQTKSIRVAGQDQSLPLAFSSIRESDSVIRAGSGQLVVIGGLMKDTTREDVASVPLLGDIPFIGSAFRHTKQSSLKSELVILLRPVVIGGDKGWRDSLIEAANSIKSSRRGFHYGAKKEVFGAAAE
ncbi:MAG: pilus (MSHA type) biogenesis protein MshL [Gammaproteobacteria bacterium]|nr:pilus (MSHA type) biogenesis protein MshL [Gammaproteobacteria bacterium]